MDISAVFSEEFPAFLFPFCECEPMQRIRRIGMNCGCEYTSFPLFRDILVFSRFDHSVGTARIVWNFTKDAAQSISALFHDVATPTFAHTVDFFNGDYCVQESTEKGIETILEASEAVRNELNKLGLSVSDVSDYHRYPIADNDSPRLSSDRLEYTLRNFVSFHMGSVAEAKKLYEDIVVSVNEDNEPELSFRTVETAVRFTSIALETGKVYVSCEDRASMQRLAELLHTAAAYGVIRREDLYTTEDAVIQKLLHDPITAELWLRFRRSARIECRMTKPEGDGWMQVFAKKRYIDPLVVGRGRVSALDGKLHDRIDAFRAQDFSEWMKIHERDL